MESTRSMQVARLPSCQVRPPSGPRLTDTDGFGDLPRPLRGSVSDGAFSVRIESESAGDVHAVRISPDGVRALVIRGSTPSAWVGVVEREPGGRPQAVRSLEQISLDGGAVIDASWTTSTGLVLAVRGEGGDNDQLVTMALGGLLRAVRCRSACRR